MLGPFAKLWCLVGCLVASRRIELNAESSNQSGGLSAKARGYFGWSPSFWVFQSTKQPTKPKATGRRVLSSPARVGVLCCAFAARCRSVFRANDGKHAFSGWDFISSKEVEGGLLSKGCALIILAFTLCIDAVRLHSRALCPLRVGSSDDSILSTQNSHEQDNGCKAGEDVSWPGPDLAKKRIPAFPRG